MELELRTQDLMRTLHLYERAIPGTRVRLMPTSGPRLRTFQPNVVVSFHGDVDPELVATWLYVVFAGSAHELRISGNLVRITRAAIRSAVLDAVTTYSYRASRRRAGPVGLYAK